MSSTENKNSSDDPDRIRTVDELIEEYATSTIDFESDESNALYEAVAREASKKDPLPETPEEIEKFLNSIPLFATKIPERGSPEESKDFKALRALADALPIETRAANMKETANKAYKLAVRMLEPRPNEGPEDVAKRLKARDDKLQEAKNAYTKAILTIMEGGDISEHRKLLSQLYSNRAQVQMNLKNYGRVIEDCRHAIRVNPTNIKAYYRAAFAGFKLQKLPQAFGMCHQALSQLDLPKDSPDRTAFIKLGNDILLLYKRTVIAERQKEAEKKEKMDKLRKERELLERAVDKRGLRVGRFEFENVDTRYDGKIYLDANKTLHFPIIFLYPEYEQTDYVRDCGEYTKISDVLKMMFPPFADRPQWDVRGDYVIGNLELSVVIGESDKYGEKQARQDEDKATREIIQVDSTLGQVLASLSKKGFVIPGCPTFTVRPIEKSEVPERSSTKPSTTSEDND